MVIIISPSFCLTTAAKTDFSIPSSSHVYVKHISNFYMSYLMGMGATGEVKADVEAVCGASSAGFTLRVTDSEGLFAEAMLDVTVAPLHLHDE
jgi:hypothetical protein